MKKMVVGNFSFLASIVIQVLGKILTIFMSASRGHITQTYFQISSDFPTSPLMQNDVHVFVFISYLRKKAIAQTNALLLQIHTHSEAATSNYSLLFT